MRAPSGEKAISQGNDLSINSFYVLDKAYQNAGKDTGYNRYGNDSGNNNFWLIEVEQAVAGFFRKAVLLSNDFRTFTDDFNSQRISVQTCKSDGKDIHERHFHRFGKNNTGNGTSDYTEGKECDKGWQNSGEVFQIDCYQIHQNDSEHGCVDKSTGADLVKAVSINQSKLSSDETDEKIPYEHADSCDFTDVVTADAAKCQDRKYIIEVICQELRNFD